MSRKRVETLATGAIELGTDEAKADGRYHGKLLTLPNILTLFRFVLIVPFVYLIARGNYLAALAVFFIAGATDFADGFIARKFNLQSYAGRLLDPLADKALIAAAYIVMAVPHPGLPSIPLWLASVVIGRDIIILAGSLIIYLVIRFKDFKPSFVSKVNTVAELAFIVYFLAVHASALGPGLVKTLSAICYSIVLITVVLSGIDYAIKGVSIIRTRR